MAGGQGGQLPTHILAKAYPKFLHKVIKDERLRIYFIFITIMIILVKNCLESLNRNKVSDTTFGGY